LFWIVGLEGDRHWPPLCEAVGHPEWMQDPRFETAKLRQENAEALISALDEIFASKTIEQWRPIFDSTEDFFWSPVQTADEVVNDPQVIAAGGLVGVPDQGSMTTLPATPVDFYGTPCEPRWMAPEHGQHTDEVLRGVGRNDEQIAALREKGAVL
jgi:crotonobetainyl-CoA:carnitine CoA-transferase CaiB-like acyl-CoA transferase